VAVRNGRRAPTLGPRRKREDRMQAIDPSEMRIFSGSSHRGLAADIAEHLGLSLDSTKIRRFSNDNLYIQLEATVRERKVFVVQSLCPPVNDHLVELLLMLDAARAAAAHQVHAVIPYFSFARSDKKDAPRISITARLVAELLRTAGASHVMTMMLHSPQVHGFFPVPTDHLSSHSVLRSHFAGKDLSDTIVVAADMGHAKSAARLARELSLPFAAGTKDRLSDTEVRVTGIVGDPVRGHRRALVHDDEIATGGTILELRRHLKAEGIEEMWVACTHGVFVRNALDRLTDLPDITSIVTTDTVPLDPSRRPSKLTVLSVAQVFGEAIRRNSLRQSLGDLFVYGGGWG